MRNEKVKVTGEQVQEWAEGTLEEWLTGYTHEVDQDQFKIVLLGNDRYRVEGTFPNNHVEPRTFLVRVSVTEQ